MEIQIDNRSADIELKEKNGNQVILDVDGKPYKVDFVMSENGSCSILYEGHSYNAEVVRLNGKKEYRVNSHYQSYNVNIIDSQAKYLRMRKKDSQKQMNQITAPMPGKIINIPIKKGQRLKTGDIVIVLEAMKMQSNYKVDNNCIVDEILVKENENVQANQVMVTFKTVKNE